MSDTEEIGEDLAGSVHDIAVAAGVDDTTAEVLISALNATYSGPLPPASQIERLNAIQPGLGTRLVEDYLLQREHQRAMDKSESERLDAGSARYSRGQVFGFTALIVLAALSAFAMYLHAYALAALFFSAPVVALVYLLITGVTGARTKPE